MLASSGTRDKREKRTGTRPIHRIVLTVALLLCVTAGLGLTAVLYLVDDSPSRQPDAGENSAPGEPTQSAQLEAALQTGRLGNYEEAIASLEAITAQDSNSASALYSLAQMQYQAGDTAGSLVSLDQYLQQFPDSENAQRALLLRAEQRVDNGDLAGAALDFAEYTAADGPAASYAFIRLGDIASQSGGSEAAITYYSRALGHGLSSYAESQVMLLLIELHDSTGDHDQAAYWAERLIVSSPSTRDRVAAISQLAQLSARIGDHDRWVDLSTQLVAEFPGTGAAQGAANALIAEQLPLSPIHHADLLIAQGDIAGAELVLLETAAQAAPTEASEAAFKLGLLRELAGDPMAALGWLVQSSPDEDAPYADELELHTLANSLQLGTLGAAADLEDFALEHRGTVLAVSAAQALARWHESESRPGSAAQLWSVASQLSLDTRDYDGAVQAAQRAAVLYDEEGDHAAANASLAAAASSDPGSFEAIWSEARLDTSRRQDLPVLYTERPADEWLAEFTASSMSSGSERLSAVESAGDELRDAGLVAESGAGLSEIAAVGRHNPAFLVQLAFAAAADGQVEVAARAGGALLTNLPIRLRQEIPVEVGALAYPRPYLETAESEAASVGVDPLLLYALIRQESFFDPRAHSSAEARGLTQVIPSTANDIAADFGLEGFTQEHLYRPGLSLAFGAYYLGAQLDAFDGFAYAALAAYNGGPGNAARWGEGQGFDDPAVYLEQIDFQETSNYVRRVMENYAHYRALYLGEGRPTLPD